MLICCPWPSEDGSTFGGGFCQVFGILAGLGFGTVWLVGTIPGAQANCSEWRYGMLCASVIIPPFAVEYTGADVLLGAATLAGREIGCEALALRGDVDEFE